jgi:hypothetical protein
VILYGSRIFTPNQTEEIIKMKNGKETHKNKILTQEKLL